MKEYEQALNRAPEYEGGADTREPVVSVPARARIGAGIQHNFFPLCAPNCPRENPESPVSAAAVPAKTCS